MSEIERDEARTARKRRPYPSDCYGMAHKAMRKRLAPVVAMGTVRCARRGELIESDEKWELDHRDDGHGWLGPRHQRCNSRAGWEKMVGKNGNGYRTTRISSRIGPDPPIDPVMLHVLALLGLIGS